jgi:hypothetical protein
MPYYVGNVLLKGYFQSEKYFPSNVSSIRTSYYPNTYFIHIRAGDYITTGRYIVTKHYYKKCIRDILKQNPNASFLVFSDDNSYAKKYLQKFKIQYKLSDTKTGYDTLIEMSNCCGAICANSSLSWLGAFFQRKPRGLIYMPSKWVYNKQKINSDIYPSWAIKMNTN